MTSLVQVRQKLYKTSIGRWKHYSPAGLAPLLVPLRRRIEKYEAAAGLESSAALLDEAAAAAEAKDADAEEQAPVAVEDDAEAYDRQRDEL